MMAISEALKHSRVDLWHVFLDKAADLGLNEEYRALLSPEEVKREQRIVVESARLQYLAGRALVRTVLSHYAGGDPRQWEFQQNSFGKPAIKAPAGLPLEFNLSHTRGLAVCAVACARAVGVDVEDCQRVTNCTGLARRYFAAAEAACLEGLSPERRQAVFFQFWTLKEAFLKARGVGLSMPLDSFAFSLTQHRPPRISFSATVPGAPHEWQFGQLLIASRYEVAVAAHMPGVPEMQILARETIPLRWQGPACPLLQNASNRWGLPR